MPLLRSWSLWRSILPILAGPAFAGALDEPAVMTPFFTDSGMKTMKPKDDMMKAWQAMSKDDQGRMTKECQDAAMSKPHAEFCADVMQFAGHK